MATFALIGDPVGQSVSPAMHNAAFAAQNLPHRYIAAQTSAADLPAALAQLRQGNWQGANVTIPHKQAVLPLLDTLTPLAAQIGAVNTIWRAADGTLHGDNTDVGGFLADLQQQMAEQHHEPDWHSQAVLVLGAGGSARAVLAGLHRLGCTLRLVARNTAAAQHMLQTLGLQQCQIFAYTDAGLAAAAAQAQIVVNCTPLGMYPNNNASPWLTAVPLPTACFAYDLIYNPSETQWVQAIRANGGKGCTGLGMLVQQGALAYQRWVGQPPPLAVMWQAAQQRLQEKAKQPAA